MKRCTPCLVASRGIVVDSKAEEARRTKNALREVAWEMSNLASSRGSPVLWTSAKKFPQTNHQHTDVVDDRRHRWGQVVHVGLLLIDPYETVMLKREVHVIHRGMPPSYPDEEVAEGVVLARVLGALPVAMHYRRSLSPRQILLHNLSRKRKIVRWIREEEAQTLFSEQSSQAVHA